MITRAHTHTYIYIHITRAKNLSGGLKGHERAPNKVAPLIFHVYSASPLFDQARWGKEKNERVKERRVVSEECAAASTLYFTAVPINSNFLGGCFSRRFFVSSLTLLCSFDFSFFPSDSSSSSFSCSDLPSSALICDAEGGLYNLFTRS